MLHDFRNSIFSFEGSTASPPYPSKKITEMSVSRAHGWNHWEWNAEILGEKPVQCDCVHHKSQVNWPGNYPGPPWWQVSDYQPDLWHGRWKINSNKLILNSRILFHRKLSGYIRRECWTGTAVDCEKHTKHIDMRCRQNAYGMEILIAVLIKITFFLDMRQSGFCT